MTELGSRAVERKIGPRNDVECAHCHKIVSFNAVERKVPQIICNVYEDGKWNRVETYHEKCYYASGLPYGYPTS